MVKSPSLRMLAALSAAAVVASVGAAVAAMFGAGVALAGPDCPSKPGVCGPSDVSAGPGHDSGDILAE